MATPRVSMAMGEAVSPAPPTTPDNANLTRRLPAAMARALCAPLPAEAIKPHPTKDYLSSVKAIYVIERLNEVFGLGGWTYRTAAVEAPAATDPKKGAMIVMHVVLRVPAYGIRLEQYGGSDNPDRGDAFKGAVTDGLTKIGSYLGIAMDVYKGGGPTRQNPRGIAVAPRPTKYTPAQEKVVNAKLAPQPAAALAEAIPEPHEEFTYEEIDLPEEERSQLEQELADSITLADRQKAERDMLRAFGGLKQRYIALAMLKTYYGFLAQYGQKHATGFRDAAEARDCYRMMTKDLLRREGVSR